MSSSDRSTILVTGGAGFVGSHFTRLARELGRSVVVLDDLSGGSRAAPSSASFVQGDIGDRALVRDLCRGHGVGAVAHFAGKIQVGESVSRPDIYFDANVVKTLALLEVIRDEGISSFLFSSSAAVYGIPATVPIPEAARREPINAYGSTKLAIELVLDAWARAYNLRWAALRYFNAAGAHADGTLRENHEPETHLIPLVVDAGLGRRSHVAIFGDDYDTPDGTCIRDFIHVQDLATAHIRALSMLEQGVTLGPLNLGTGSGYSVREVIDVAGRIIGKPVPHIVSSRREGDPPSLVADPSHAVSVLGWRPERSSLETIVEDTLRSRRQ